MTFDATDEELVRKFLQLGREFGVRRMRVGSFMVRYADSPEQAQPVAESARAVEETCKCGHSLDVEHNEVGCLRGCALDVCGGGVA